MNEMKEMNEMNEMNEMKEQKVMEVIENDINSFSKLVLSIAINQVANTVNELIKVIKKETGK